MKNFFQLSLIIITAMFLISCDSSNNQSKETKIAQNTNNNAAPAKKDEQKNNEPIKIAAGGDIMMGSPYPNASRMPPNDGKDLLKVVTPIFEKADIAFANLEGPLFDSGNSGKCGASAGITCFAFRMPTRYAAYLKDAGFDVLSLANNHAGDFGDMGRETTRKTLDSVGIKHAGSDRNEFAMTFLEVKGKKVAVVAFAHNSIVPNVNELENAKILVEKAASQADIVMVSFHGGAEGAVNAHVPQRTEIFLGEARGNLPAFARTVIDAGADIVIGHGPHVLRGMEMYKDRLIAYSLGNFETYGWFPLVGATAETLVLEVNLAADGKFIDGKINPFVQHGRGDLTPDPNKSSIRTIKSLSQSDFPNSMPKISDDGIITH
ncbi:MAG TPA: CapA family protein [Pyrinomonadaceae bacterium]|nr:CapA family protein [Pyrinomonadaceae bacterium]